MNVINIIDTHIYTYQVIIITSIKYCSVTVHRCINAATMKYCEMVNLRDYFMDNCNVI